MVPEINVLVLSSDDADIAHAVQSHGVRWMPRPGELATDESPVWETVRHTLKEVERFGPAYDYVVLLEPTSPFRRPEWISGALKSLEINPGADGIHGCSLTDHNPIWNAFKVDPHTGFLDYLIPEGRFHHRRQDMPNTYKQDGSLHIWRAGFVRENEGGYQWGKHIMFETDPLWACSIDTLEEFDRAEGLVTAGLIKLPWEAR